MDLNEFMADFARLQNPTDYSVPALRSRITHTGPSRIRQSSNYGKIITNAPQGKLSMPPGKSYSFQPVRANINPSFDAKWEGDYTFPTLNAIANNLENAMAKGSPNIATSIGNITKSFSARRQAKKLAIAQAEEDALRPARSAALRASNQQAAAQNALLPVPPGASQPYTSTQFAGPQRPSVSQVQARVDAQRAAGAVRERQESGVVDMQERSRQAVAADRRKQLGIGKPNFATPADYPPVRLFPSTTTLPGVGGPTHEAVVERVARQQAAGEARKKEEEEKKKESEQSSGKRPQSTKPAESNGPAKTTKSSIIEQPPVKPVKAKSKITPPKTDKKGKA